MLRRLCALILACCMLMPCLALAEGEALYRARTVGSTSVFKVPDGEHGERVATIKKGVWVQILAVDPTYALAVVNGVTGYVYRSRLEQVAALDPAGTPPYGVEVFGYTARVCSDAKVTSEKGAGDTLVTLYEGARLALIGMEDGYGKLIYHRQYAYVDTRCLTALGNVRGAPDEALPAPIAAYTSYYRLTDTEANIGRMKNIAVACEKLSAITLMPGESLDFNKQIGPYSKRNGYFVAPVLVDGETKLNYGGGTCQVSSTLYNVVLQLPGLTVVKRRAHGPSGASYLPHGVDAAVGNSALNFVFRNDYDFPVHIDASAQDGALYIAIWRADDMAED